MQKIKKGLAFLLAVIMIIGLVPASVFADDAGTNCTVTINFVFENDETAAQSYTAKLVKGDTYGTSVDVPAVVGYTPSEPAYDADKVTVTFTTTSLTYSVANIQSDITLNVIYAPALVNYTVNYYQQNVEDDNYSRVLTETRTGLTGAQVAETYENLKNKYTGFYGLRFEEPKIAADGSTVVEIYYDRDYYLMDFVLGDDGYGVDPIFARYGTPVSVDTPTRPGYTFTGWDETIPATMPAENKEYTATWEAPESVNVTVVLWGENANDEGYSYNSLKTIQARVGEELTWLTCGREAHQHTDSCLNCGHIHDARCYGATSLTPVNVNSGVVNHFSQLKVDGSAGLKSGYIYRYKYISPTYYLYYEGQWYDTDSEACATGVLDQNYSGGHYYYVYKAQDCSHTHTDACYTCGMTTHTHTPDCCLDPNAMDPARWTLNHSDTVTVAADGTTILNVYYNRKTFTLTFKDNSTTVRTIAEKWGTDIHDNFPIKDGSKTIWWEVPNECKSFNPGKYLGSINTMPAENIVFTKEDSESGANLWYYVEVLEGENGTYTYDGIQFKLYKKIDIKYSSNISLTYSEEFHDIIGFTQWWSDPSFSSHTQSGSASIKTNNYLCYTRNKYELSFYNYNGVMEDHVYSVQYEAPLASKNFVPAYPSGLEPNAYEFGGWYTTSGCFEGSEVDFDTMTMPAGDLMLYAKWTPITHEATFRVTFASDSEQLSDQTVPHGSYAVTPTAPTNGNYEFVGWFYDDNGVEKAYSPNLRITKDINVYAKWRSNTLLNYTIKYQLADGTSIAADTTGSALAGTTKTFEAKGGDELYAAYQEGFFPEVKSHAVEMDIEKDEIVYTFIYEEVAAVPYTVKYLDRATGEAVATPKTDEENRKAVVTERAKTVSGYMPEVFQQRLVVTPEGENVLIFYYNADAQHAIVSRTYYTVSGSVTTEYRHTEETGTIGQTYSAEKIGIQYYELYKITVNGTEVGLDTSLDRTLDGEGLNYEFYYRQISCTADTVVVDFGLPVSIDVLGNDSFGAATTFALHGITATQPMLGITIDKGISTTEIISTSSATLDGGTFRITDGKILFTPKTMTFDKAIKVYYDVQLGGSNRYMYSSLTVIPATTIYYEDSFVTFDGNWENAGTAQTTVRTAETAGVYGYDAAYKDCTEYSLGSAMKTTVSEGMKEWPTATFTFTGTGFEIISVTDSKTGAIKVNVAGEGVTYNWVVDTYYGCEASSTAYDRYMLYDLEGVWHVYASVTDNDNVGEGQIKVDKFPENPVPGNKYVMFQPTISTSARGTLYQIPVIKKTGLTYGTYTVTVTPVYSFFFDHVHNATDTDKSYDFYLDGIRVYEPADTTNAGYKDILAAYKDDNEAYPQFIEIRDELINNGFNPAIDGAYFLDTTKVTAGVFIDGFADPVDVIADYANYGPNNEVYLMNGQGIAFALNADTSKIASIQIAAKSPTGGAGFTVGSKTFEINTATEMYYDITEYVKDADGSFEEGIAVIASGDEGAILSLTNLKITFTSDPTAKTLLRAPSRTFLTAAVNRMLSPVQPATEPETEPATEPETEPATEPETEPATEPETEPATEPATEPETEPATEPESKDAKKAAEKALKEAVKAAEKTVKEAAKAAEKAVKEAAKAAEKAAKTVSNVLGNVFNALKGNAKKTK